ncbi:hypothetical protein [Pedobacter duraquae]|uniref:Uncharacterized protein n=1 Tax=Pedobacter duraquae TaxID=425511 RepID=A0A4V3C364_9SPHI|nr:hypothetical protein [Pedobacter duraquae]TDO20849.1 hypothetical protein CLV32_3483 [Pedobacter duraquae]
MNNLDDMKSLWRTVTTDKLPTSEEMLKLIRKFRREKLRNKWLVIVTCLLSSCLVVAALIIAHFKMATTYAGGILVVIAALFLAFNNIRSLKRFYHMDDYDNLKFLEFLAKTRENQIRYYKRTMVIVISLSASGWILYVYELVYHYPMWSIIVYLIMSVYLGVMWFIVRPRSFKRDQGKLNATRERVESILNQLK